MTDEDQGGVAMTRRGFTLINAILIAGLILIAITIIITCLNHFQHKGAIDKEHPNQTGRLPSQDFPIPDNTVIFTETYGDVDVRVRTQRETPFNIGYYYLSAYPSYWEDVPVLVTLKVQGRVTSEKPNKFPAKLTVQNGNRTSTSDINPGEFNHGSRYFVWNGWQIPPDIVNFVIEETGPDDSP